MFNPALFLWLSFCAAGPAPEPPRTIRPAALRITPLADGRVGDWALYQSDLGAQRLELTHKTLLLADISVRVSVDGAPTGRPAVRTLRLDRDEALDEAPRDGQTIEQAEDTIDAAGRRWRCRRTVVRWTDGGRSYERRHWMNADVPVLGIVRSELLEDGRVLTRRTLSAHGRGSAEEAPQ